MQFSVNIKLHSYCYTFLQFSTLVRLNVFGSLLCNTWSSQQFLCSCFVLRSSTPWPWRIGIGSRSKWAIIPNICVKVKSYFPDTDTHTRFLCFGALTSNNIHTFVQPYVVTLEAVTYLTSGLSGIRSVRWSCHVIKSRPALHIADNSA